MPFVDPKTLKPIENPKDTFYHGPIPPLPPGTGEAAARSYAMGKPLPTALAPSPTATPSAGPTPIPGHLEALANKFRQTKYGKVAADVGNEVKKFLVPSTKTGQAIALASMIPPVAGLLRVGSELPLIGKGLEVASQIGEARFVPAMARLGLLGGAGAVGAHQEGQSPIAGAVEGLEGGAIGEGIGILANPKYQSKKLAQDFGKWTSTVLKDLPGLINDIKAGKNPLIAIREAWPEANAVYGKAMESISQDLGQLPVFKHPLKGDMDFDSFKAEIDKLSKKGWANGVPRSTDEGARARALRAKLVAQMQKKLEEMDNLASQQAGNLPSVLNQPGQGQPFMRPSNLAQRFREANRQYEKMGILSELANKKNLLGRKRIRPSRMQEIMRDEMLPKLKKKLSPLEYMDLRDTIFMKSPKGISETSAPGPLQRKAMPSVYGGGASLRMRLPIGGHETPNVSQYVGYGPKTPQWLRMLATLLGVTNIAEPLETSRRENQ